MLKTGHRGRARRLGTHLTSAVLLAAQLLVFGHLALAHHVACPQHGDVMHSPHALESVPSGSRGDPASSGPIAGTTPNAEPTHDHCLICTSTRERYILWPPACHGAVDFQLSVPFPTASDVDALVPVAPIAFSPKTSPPVG